MRLTKLLVIAACAIFTNAAMATESQDLKDLLNSAASKATSGSNGSNALGAVGSLISSFTATSNFELKDLQGVWAYESPAVTFQSDNALQKVGGVAAASTIESKLAPYYQKAGITALVLTVNSDLTFSMKLAKGTLTGTITKNDSGNLEFNFSAFGKFNLGKLSAYATKSGNTLNLTFDVSKLVAVLKKVSSVAGNASLSTITSLLSSYDGIYAGFKLNRTGDAPAK